jgi:hypothetical protein
MVTRRYTGSIFAVTADSSECGVFAQRHDAVILRMIKIIAAGLAFFALTTDLQVDK